METTNMLIRLRELAVQASSDTVGTQERGFLDQEYQALKLEIDRIANSTEFNGTRLLIGQVEMPEDMRGNENQFPLEVQISKDYYINSDAIDNANPTNIIRIDLQGLNAFSQGENSLQLNESTTGEALTGITEKRQAQLSINRLDSAITRVNEYRAYLGAIQNRFGSTIQNLGVQIENLDTARSRIRDTDFASETAEYTKTKILQQAGTSVLAQANAQPQIALGLLQAM